MKCVIPLLIKEVLKTGFSVKYVDAFRIALTEESKLLIKQNIAKIVNYLSYYHSLTLKIISF